MPTTVGLKTRGGERRRRTGIDRFKGRVRRRVERGSKGKGVKRNEKEKEERYLGKTTSRYKKTEIDSSTGTGHRLGHYKQMSSKLCGSPKGL